MVDTIGLGPIAFKSMEVRVLSSAPIKYLYIMKITQSKPHKNTIKVEAVLDEGEVLAEKEHAVDVLISTVTVKGFRQGKAPRSIAADHIDPDKLSNHILNHLLNHLVSKLITENKLQLLGRPVLENIDSEEKQGWTIKLSLPLYPTFSVEGYKELLPKSPKSKTSKEGKTTFEKEEKIEKIYQALLGGIKMDIPHSVIEEETNYSLERLSEQAKTLNLTLEEYLKAVKKNLEEIKNEYRLKAEEAIKLDLILLEIAKKEKISTTNEEVEEVAKLSGLPVNQHDRLKSIVDRRKTIEHLINLC